MLFKITYVLEASNRAAADGASVSREITCAKEGKSLKHIMREVLDELGTRKFIDLVDDSEKGHIVNAAAIQCIDFDIL